jgi:hypothetical protein
VTFKSRAVWSLRGGKRLRAELFCFFQLQAKYDRVTGTEKSQAKEPEVEDKQLLTSESEEVRNNLQVFRKHVVDLTPNITT